MGGAAMKHGQLYAVLFIESQMKPILLHNRSRSSADDSGHGALSSSP